MHQTVITLRAEHFSQNSCVSVEFKPSKYFKPLAKLAETSILRGLLRAQGEMLSKSNWQNENISNSTVSTNFEPQIYRPNDVRCWRVKQRTSISLRWPHTAFPKIFCFFFVFLVLTIIILLPWCISLLSGYIDRIPWRRRWGARPTPAVAAS